MKLKEREKQSITKLASDLISAQAAEFTIGKPGEKPISYVITKEGVLEVRRTQVGIFSKVKSKMDVKNVQEVIETMSKVPGISMEIAKVKESLDNLASMSSTPAFQLLTPKIPIMFFHQIVTFFRDVHAKQGTEAAALIRWNQERQEYYVEIPSGPDGKEQDLSAGSVKYKPDPTNKDIIVMDIHSHHTMTDFFSSIDDADEQFTQLYGVVGNIDHSSPTASFRARMHGEDIATPVIEDIFDISPYPENWMEKIKEPPKSLATEYSGPPWAGVTEDDRPWMGDVRDADVPPSTQDKWYERRMGESLSDYARRMQDIKNGSRGSLPRDFPTQKDGEEDEAYLKRITGQAKEPAPTMGDVLNGDEILTAQSEVWDVIENELLERAEIYQYRTPLMALRDYINDKFNEVNTSELAQWAKA